MELKQRDKQTLDPGRRTTPWSFATAVARRLPSVTKLGLWNEPCNILKVS